MADKKCIEPQVETAIVVLGQALLVDSISEDEKTILKIKAEDYRRSRISAENMASFLLQYRLIPFALQQRLIKAAEQHFRHGGIMILTGGDVSDCGISEALAMHCLLMGQHGVRKCSMIMDELARNTLQNAWNVQEILHGLGTIKNVVLVTSDFHMPRSIYSFKAVFEQRGYATESLSECSSATAMNPSLFEKEYRRCLESTDATVSPTVRSVDEMLMQDIPNQAIAQLNTRLRQQLAYDTKANLLLHKIKRNLVASTSDPFHRPRHVFLVLGGSFSPVHSGHIDIFHICKEELLNQGIVVVGGFLGLSSDSWVRGKLSDEALCLSDRVHLCELACKEDDLVVPVPWGEASASNTVKVIENLLAQDRDIQSAVKTRVEGFVLCGADVLSRGAYAQSRVVCVSRVGPDFADLRSRIWPGNEKLFVERPSPPSPPPPPISSSSPASSSSSSSSSPLLASASSTLCRRLLKAGKWEELSGLLHPSVISWYRSLTGVVGTVVDDSVGGSGGSVARVRPSSGGGGGWSKKGMDIAAAVTETTPDTAIATAAKVSAAAAVGDPTSASALAQKGKMCRAPGCDKCVPGAAHYCKVCKQHDVTHRSAFCPKLQPQPVGVDVSIGGSGRSIARAGVSVGGSAGSSRSGGKKDVSAAAALTKTVATSRMAIATAAKVGAAAAVGDPTSAGAVTQKGKACRAPGCDKCVPGAAHYCKVCKQHDVTHRSAFCPKLQPQPQSSM